MRPPHDHLFPKHDCTPPHERARDEDALDEALAYARILVDDPRLADYLVRPTSALDFPCRPAAYATGGCGAKRQEPCVGEGTCHVRFTAARFLREAAIAHSQHFECPTCTILPGRSCQDAGFDACPTCQQPTIPRPAFAEKRGEYGHTSRKKLNDAWQAAWGIPPLGTKEYARWVDAWRRPQDVTWTRELATAVYVREWNRTDAARRAWAKPRLERIDQGALAPTTRRDGTPLPTPPAKAPKPRPAPKKPEDRLVHEGPGGGSHPGPFEACPRPQCQKRRAKLAEHAEATRDVVAELATNGTTDDAQAPYGSTHRP